MLYLSNCLIRCVCKKSLLSFSYFSMVIKKNMQNQNKFVGNSLSLAPPPPLLPLYMCCNIHHFGIAKRKVMGSKTTSYSHKTTSYAHKTTSYARKTTSYAHKTTSYAHKTTSYVHKTTSYAFKTYKFDS